MTGDFTANDGPHHFRLSTSCSIERSSVRSATSRLSLLFSSSSCFSRRISGTPTGGDNLCARGAYVIAEADGERRVTLIGTGSEVALALAARDILQGEGVPTAVVSMPSWELFARQEDAYRAKSA